MNLGDAHVVAVHEAEYRNVGQLCIHCEAVEITVDVANVRARDKFHRAAAEIRWCQNQRTFNARIY